MDKHIGIVGAGFAVAAAKLSLFELDPGCIAALFGLGQCWCCHLVDHAL